MMVRRPSLPRGIPAASLKRAWAVMLGEDGRRKSSAGNTRGLIEASCGGCDPLRGEVSSAGNTRGLIEASYGARKANPGSPSSSAGNTRGLIEAVIWLGPRSRMMGSSAGNTRGLIEASPHAVSLPRRSHVFRGEYPRPH